MHRVTIIALFLVTGTRAAAQQVRAGAQQVRAGAQQVRAGGSCRALFGDARTRARNAAHRTETIEFIEEDASGVTLAHASDRWEEPWSLQLTGLELVAIEGESALFEVKPGLASSVGCSAGTYRVTVDDALSRDTHVLAVLRQAVLVELRGTLRYILLPGAEYPLWLVAWRLPGVIGATYDPSAPAPHYEPQTTLY
jgi:hypothetical protein